MTVGIVDTIVYIGQSLGILLGSVLFALSQAEGMLHLDINHVTTLWMMLMLVSMQKGDRNVLLFVACRYATDGNPSNWQVEFHFTHPALSKVVKWKE